MTYVRTILWIASAAVLCASPAAFADGTRQPDTFGGYASTQVVIQVEPGVTPAQGADGGPLLVRRGARAADIEADLADLFRRFEVTAIAPTADPPPRDAALARELGLDRYYTVFVPEGSDTPALVDELLAHDGYIQRAELDGVGGVMATFPNDPSFNQQYSLHNTGQTIQGQAGVSDADIDAPEAWDLHTGTSDVIVAIIDTGISQSHPELKNKQVPGRNFSSEGSASDTDDSWFLSHGSHCSGIATATTNNGQGIAGVSWGAKLMPIKVLNWFGSGTETECGNGVIWAADHGADVGSMSLGYPDGISFFENAINYAHGQGMVLCASTGNTPGAQIFFPARWTNTIAVGATDNRDLLADFTTTGPQMSVTAPGVDVYSCWDTFFSANTYSYESGTSMSCPHVAGLAALVWSANPGLTNDEVRTLIESTADDKGSAGWDPSFGHGRINAYNAVVAAMVTAEIEAARSCRTHGAAGEFCLQLGFGDTPGDNCDPRAGSVEYLEFDVSAAVSDFGATVDCGAAYSGSISTLGGGETIGVEFDPPLPADDCCTITLSGGLDDTFAVATLEGDVDRNLMVNSVDFSAIKPWFGAAVGGESFLYDVNVDGLINSLDGAVVKPRFGHQLPGCP